MPTEAKKLDILNSALRMVGSYHLESTDTTSTTYEIADSAYSQAVTELFGDNIFNYNTKRVKLRAVQGIETSFTDEQGYTSTGNAADNPDWEGNTILPDQWTVSPSTDTITTVGNYKNLRNTSTVTGYPGQIIKFEHVFDFGPGTRVASTGGKRAYMFSITEMDQYPDTNPDENVLSNPNITMMIKLVSSGSSLQLINKATNNVLGTMPFSVADDSGLMTGTIELVVGDTAATSSYSVSLVAGTDSIAAGFQGVPDNLYNAIIRNIGVKANVQSGAADGITAISVHSVFFKNTTTAAAISTDFKNYPYQFTLPADYNVFIKAEDEDDRPATNYVFSNGFLYCSSPVLNVTYTFVPVIETSATTLPAFLSRLLTLHMAQNMAIELSGSENRHEILHKQYVLALRRARTLEGRQGPAQQYIDSGNSSFISAHQNYGKV
ncbi:hypothetical protein [Sneathiella sp.]|jgi:hypothetical protein|uniref:hypothetical protein n=1 Tax=Sneathiella sp. TaxID=1964365 RepID=UPI0025F686F2|nr:hypothetical protein [Sneathiella sp.]|tara:strand:+ start:94 stop:1401 length:1308 start_codon:yes stop_codon:yes gene_type:complete